MLYLGPVVTLLRAITYSIITTLLNRLDFYDNGRDIRYLPHLHRRKTKADNENCWHTRAPALSRGRTDVTGAFTKILWLDNKTAQPEVWKMGIFTSPDQLFRSAIKDTLLDWIYSAWRVLELTPRHLSHVPRPPAPSQLWNAKQGEKVYFKDSVWSQGLPSAFKVEKLGMADKPLQLKILFFGNSSCLIENRAVQHKDLTIRTRTAPEETILFYSYHYRVFHWNMPLFN